jgi:hypothetical protein
MTLATDPRSIARSYVSALQHGDENTERTLSATGRSAVSEYMDTLYARNTASGGG